MYVGRVIVIALKKKCLVSVRGPPPLGSLTALA